MAFYQFLLFRKRRYRKQVPEKYADKTDHEKNIKRKQKQIVDSKWNFYANLWALPFSGGLSGVTALLNLRTLHIARQKLRVLEKAYKDKYGEKVPWEKEGRKGILKKLCSCIADPVISDVIEPELTGGDYGDKDGGATSAAGDGYTAQNQASITQPGVGANQNTTFSNSDNTMQNNGIRT